MGQSWGFKVLLLVAHPPQADCRFEMGSKGADALHTRNIAALSRQSKTDGYNSFLQSPPQEKQNICSP